MKGDQATRLCKKCLRVRPIEAFNFYGMGTHGRRHECRECQAKRMAATHKRNRKRRAAAARARYAKNPSAYWTPERRKRANNLARIRGRTLRNAALDAYGGQCTCCGEKERRFLTIDHENDDGKEMRKVHGVGWVMYGWLAKRGFPPGYQVLCFNCNLGRALNGGICPHRNGEGSTTRAKARTAKRPEAPRARTLRVKI